MRKGRCLIIVYFQGEITAKLVASFPLRGRIYILSIPGADQ